jgi:hypothetical protein
MATTKEIGNSAGDQPPTFQPCRHYSIRSRHFYDWVDSVYQETARWVDWETLWYRLHQCKDVAKRSLPTMEQVQRWVWPPPTPDISEEWVDVCVVKKKKI